MWNLLTVNADEISIEAPQEKVKVAIIDSGVDYTEDIDVYVRKNFVPGEDEVSIIYEDICGHGTSVAGIIAAKDNEIGITGINPNVELYSARVLDAEKKAPVSRVVDAIYWAIENEVNIINLSFGTTTDSPELREAIEAADEAGILIIAAAGNSGVVEYPAAYDEVIAVGAVDAQGNHSEGSAVGEELELVAPGEQIASTGAFGGICVVGGTSMAAPHVTAIASVLWQKDLSVSADFIRSLLAFTANQYGDSDEYGYGLVDLEFALSQYDAFKANYSEEDLAEAVEEAVAAGELQENEAEVVVFDDVAYVEGSWYAVEHTGLLLNANVDNMGNMIYLSTTELSIVKLGALAPDTYWIGMKRNAEWHGYMNHVPTGASSEDYYSNYIYAYLYITEMAASMNNYGSLIASVNAECLVHTEGCDCISKMKNNINSKFYSAGIYKQKDGVICGTVSWSKILNGLAVTNRNKALFIYGLALHTATDSFAHSTYEGRNRLDHEEDCMADVVDYLPNRYDCAEVISKRLVLNVVSAKQASIADYIAIQSVYDGSFKMARFGTYVKGIDTNAYNKNTTFLNQINKNVN
ncbi:MAG: S8 family serine peptidase [Lachnospiraceae bacterium]|nr:S8 family serine peptidase [Lachnospiraceae bacterium]